MLLRYRFAPDDKPAKEVSLDLDPDTLALPAPPGEPPEWAKLDNHKCSDCPLKSAEHPHCPVAVRLAPLVATFKDDISFDQAQVTVDAQDRVYSKRAPMQFGVSGLFGVVMATSGCPILDKLRPMVFLHLPFSNARETVYRSLSMYLLGQHIVAEKGGVPDWNLSGLAALYESISRVNRDFVKRLHSQVTEDATLNAVVNLDCFAAHGAAASKAPKAWLEKLFKPYLP